MKNEITRNYSEILEKVDRAAERADRKTEEIRVMAVTKNHPVETVSAAYECGIRLMGENRVQEALDKFTEKPSDIELHMIGHLQRNKAARAAALFDCIQSLDSLRLAQALNRIAAESGTRLPVLLEIDFTNSPARSGFKGREAVLDFMEQRDSLGNLDIRGLMTIAPFTDNETAVRSVFSAARELYWLLAGAADAMSFSVLSMGMSGDYIAAIEEGSTLVRIGTALFGRRNYT